MAAHKEDQAPIDREKLQRDAKALVREAATLRVNVIQRLDRLTRKLAGEIAGAEGDDETVVAKVHDLNAVFSVLGQMTSPRPGFPRSGPGLSPGPRLPPGAMGWLMIGGEPVLIPRGGGLICNSKGVCIHVTTREHLGV